MRWFWLIGFALALILAGVYAYLGGFRQPEVAVITTAKPIFLAGRYYNGPVRGDEFGTLFRQAQQVKANNHLQGTLGNIYYNDPEAAGDTVKAFIGLIVADTVSQNLPPGYHYSTFSGGQRVVQARLKASYMLAPGKLYSGIKDFAKQQKLGLGQVYVEQFPDTGPVEVLAVVK
ncbi:hypothetical protein SAMN00120144_3045 [Hymenobacter roseosalivarius DSM 11622]|uniref:GyrI-like small molecule binding domain-containing protein n=1 Tax=Hymenobacter roseosalivarius DSM 11622 TaxID=645990 RepID=A0A1W1ULX9_9BACT|nr:hypothetical protein [Hymenobacter roseosalivarius]SMB82023.1 hypothetical protein SAMN00120144_3045 [Hymenobacter roseosalivarius DSM 11622]